MEPAPQSRSYWSTCHSTHGNIKPTCNQIRNKNHTDETRHWAQPPQISEQYSWWYAGFCLPATWSPLKSFSYFILQVGCCVSLHPLGGAEHKIVALRLGSLRTSQRPWTQPILAYLQSMVKLWLQSMVKLVWRFSHSCWVVGWAPSIPFCATTRERSWRATWTI